MSLLLALTGGGGSSYTLACDAGAYSYVGNDATLTYVPAASGNYTLACDAGAYSYTGGDATLSYVSAAPASTGGGVPWSLSARSGLDREGLKRARKRLGLIPEDVKTAIIEVAAKEVKRSGVPNDFDQHLARYEEQVRALIESQWKDAYLQILREEMQRQDDELIVWLLLSH